MDDTQPLVFGRYQIEAGRPRAYTRRTGPLTPALRRWMLSKGWIDARTVTRLERPDAAQVALMARIRQDGAA